MRSDTGDSVFVRPVAAEADFDPAPKTWMGG